MQKIQVMFIVSLVFAIIITIFALTNATPVVISLFFYKFTASQALIIFISAALGAVIVTSLGIVRHIKLKNEIKVLHKANDELSARIQSLSDEIEAAKLQKPEAEASDKDKAPAVNGNGE